MREPTPADHYYRVGRQTRESEEDFIRGQTGMSRVRSFDFGGNPIPPPNATPQQLQQAQQMRRAASGVQPQGQPQQQPMHPMGPEYAAGQMAATGGSFDPAPAQRGPSYGANPLPSGVAGPNPGRGLQPHERGMVSGAGLLPPMAVQQQMRQFDPAPRSPAPGGYHMAYKSGGRYVGERRDGRKHSFDTEESAVAYSRGDLEPAPEIRQQAPGVPFAPTPSAPVAEAPQGPAAAEQGARPSFDQTTPEDRLSLAGARLESTLNPSKRARAYGDVQKARRELIDRSRAEGLNPGASVDREPEAPTVDDRRARGQYGSPQNQWVANAFGRAMEAGNASYRPHREPGSIFGIPTGENDQRVAQERNRRYIEQETASISRFAPDSEQRRRRAQAFYDRLREAGIVGSVPSETWTALGLPQPPKGAAGDSQPPVSGPRARDLLREFDGPKTASPPPAIRTAAVPSPVFEDIDGQLPRRTPRRVPMPAGAGTVAF